MIDVDALEAWMDKWGAPGSGPISASLVTGGSQNEIYDVRRGDLRAALRIPPLSAPQSRDAGVLREWRIVEALRDTDVPHTPAIVLCTDSTVLGRPFYLMRFVDGWSPIAESGWPEPFNSDLSARRDLGFELVDAIAKLSKVDWQNKGLHDLGRPIGFHNRQVDRWTTFLEPIKRRELPGFSEASGWLRTHKPIDFLPGLMHGDYQFANVMYEHGAPAKLAAIVDWEMGTIGDPKLDLAWVMQAWPENTDVGVPGPGFGYVDLRGMPSKDELLDHYRRASGRQVDDIDYYVVLAFWKLAVVLEHGFQRASGDPKLTAFGPIVLDLFHRAAELAETTRYA